MSSLKQEEGDEIGFKASELFAPEPLRPGTERMHSKIKYLKQELTYCEKIKEQTQMIKTNLKEIEQKENEKENEKIRKGEIEK